MSTLSLFIDESGDFGPYSPHSPYFNALLDAEIRRVMPSDYRLFQAADMACTLELLDLKYRAAALSSSEIEFFRGERNLHKNNLKVAYSKRFEPLR